MRIVVNGWFREQLTTGSGQYLAELAARLPAINGEHEFILVCHSCHSPANVTNGGPAAASEKQPNRQSGGPAGGPPRRRGQGLHNSEWRVIEAATPVERYGENIVKVWFEQITFPRLCRHLRADVALVPYWGSPWWRPCPVAVTIHDLIPLLLPLYRGGPAQRLYTALVSRTAQRAAAVLTDSEASRRDIIARLAISPERVHAAHLAAGPQYRRITDAQQLSGVRARYGLPDEPFLLYLGGFDSRKNLIRTLEAYARAARGADHGEEGAFPRLVIAGRPPARSSAFAPDPQPVARRLGVADRVHFAGWVDEADKPALYSLACAALFVSEYEGFGLPVLEAQACGCPVITSAR